MVMENQEKMTQYNPKKKYGSKKKRPRIGDFLASFDKSSDD